MDDRIRQQVARALRVPVLLVIAVTSAVAACRHSGRPAKPAVDSLAVDSSLSRAAEDTAAVADSTTAGPTDTSGRAAPKAPLPPTLSPLADTIAQYVVFVPATQTWFVVASRGKRVLLDLGRVDADVKTKPHRMGAYVEAVRKLSPVPIGTHFRLFTQDGVADVAVKGFDVWNGRVVATLATPHAIDSIGRTAPLFVASAVRVDSARADSLRRVDSAAQADTATGSHPDSAKGDSAKADTCHRGNVPDSLRARVLAVRDSLITWLESLPPPPYQRLVKTEKPQWSTIVGCFGGPRRIALAVDLRAGNNEWIRERVVLIDTLGAVTTLRVSDLRFKGHDLLMAMDADGDGLDDLATRGFAEAAGGITILKLTDKNRLIRLAGGFAWESR
jgi:hypothetical protein